MGGLSHRAACASYTAAMKPCAHDPLRLAVEAFAKEGGRLEGRWPLAGF